MNPFIIPLFLIVPVIIMTTCKFLFKFNPIEFHHLYGGWALLWITCIFPITSNYIIPIAAIIMLDDIIGHIKARFGYEEQFILEPLLPMKFRIWMWNRYKKFEQKKSK